MTDSVGRSAADAASGHSSETEPSFTVSAQSVSVPNAVCVLIRSTGEYSDRQEQAVCAVPSEDDAKLLVVAAEHQWRAAIVRHPRVDWNCDTDEDYERYDIARAARLQRVAAECTIDPGAADDWDEEPYYFYQQVPLFASAIEAQRAETATKIGGSVHESAAAKPDAQKGSSNGI